MQLPRPLPDQRSLPGPAYVARSPHCGPLSSTAAFPPLSPSPSPIARSQNARPTCPRAGAFARDLISVGHLGSSTRDPHFSPNTPSSAPSLAADRCPLHSLGRRSARRATAATKAGPSAGTLPKGQGFAPRYLNDEPSVQSSTWMNRKPTPPVASMARLTSSWKMNLRASSFNAMSSLCFSGSSAMRS